MARGNADNLRAAAKRKHDEAVARAEKAIRALVRDGVPVNFRAVARLAECSPNFLYRTPWLRERIGRLRAQARSPTPAPQSQSLTGSNGTVIRELAGQLADEKRRRREEVVALKAALAAAHGELLELRRQVATEASHKR